MQVEVTINPDVLKWALERTELSENEIEKKFPKLKEWQSGLKKPTLSQAKKLAKAARLPLGRLLLPVSTPEDIAIPDFRTVRNATVDSVGADLREVIQTAEQRLGWYAEYASETGIEPPKVLGIASVSSSPNEAAEIVREALGWDSTGHPKGSDKVMDLVNRMEDHGLLVMRNSIVGNSTSRRLDVHEFRGFTLREGPYALVFVNTSDSKIAQLFSLAHELGHVAKAAPGLSGDQGKSNKTEQWCNKFAAALLIPEASVRRVAFDSDGLLNQLAITATRFGVSKEALLWRLVDLELVERKDADRVVGFVKGQNASQKAKTDGAPPFPVLIRSRVGRRFLSTVTEAALSGDLPEPDAAEFLGIRTKSTLHKVMALVDEAV
ncbi:MAG: ImmA/IrrE family metallo-endopeptidase [Corynebacterium sp.]|nr:ImmA/IrrE family metallo-endopeptidase [Corynebacterium sp.]